jgi:hypothetical protein
MEEVESRYIEAPRKELFRLQIPYILRFSIIWTLFFVIVGVLIQFLSVPNQIFGEVLKNFFTTNYIDWFASFGNFTNVTIYPTALDFVYSLIGHWYYFFYTGGLLSLIWGFLSWIIHFEFVFKKKEKTQESPAVVKPLIVPQKVDPSRFVSPVKEKINGSLPIEDWIDQGLLLLSQRNIQEAELIYNEVKRAYDPKEDYNQRIYKRILDFYYEIMDEKSLPKRRESDTWEG